MAYILSLQLFAFNTFHSTESLDNKASLLQVPCYSFRHINQHAVSAKKNKKQKKTKELIGNHFRGQSI